MLFVFFFQQKTAYEMRISDWSSDVCSSDLSQVMPNPLQRQGAFAADVQPGDPLLQEPQRTAGVKVVVGVGINSMPQAHQPAALGVAGGQLGRHAEGFKHGEIERRTPRKLRLQAARKSVGKGKSVSVSVGIGGRRNMKKKK